MALNTPSRARRQSAVAAEKMKNLIFVLPTKNDPDIHKRMKTQNLMKASAPTRIRNQSVSINLEKSLSRYALATATIAAVAIPAAAKADFSGPYAPAHGT